MPNFHQQREDQAAYTQWWDAEKRRADELKARQDELIKQARENLKRVVAEDKAVGLIDSAALRDVRPVRPAILDVTLEWDATPERRAKFDKARSEALNGYYEHLVLANPSLLSPEQLKELPGAIRHCDAAVKAAQAAQDEKR